MKVVDDKKTTWSLSINCPDCKSAIEIEAQDVYWQSLGSFDEFSTYYFADCGACKSSIDLTKKKLPDWVKNQASKNRPSRP
jgi:hypothetical protein